MNFLNLKYFLAVAKELNFTKAAQNLFISQQALSNHINRLENEFNVKLFERSPKLKLTYAGVCAERMAKQILDLEDQLATQLTDIADGHRGILTIGISHMRSLVFLPEVLPQFCAQNPNIEIRLDVDITDVLEKKLINGDIDLVIGYRPFYKKIGSSIGMLNIMIDQLCLIVPDKIIADYYPDNTDDIISELENNVDISLFADAPFLLSSKGSRIRKIIDRFFSQHNVLPNIILECDALETLLVLCISGMGITFCFESLAKIHISSFQQTKSNATHIFPLNYSDGIEKIMIGYNKERYLSRAAKDFIDMSIEIFKGNSVKTLL